MIPGHIALAFLAVLSQEPTVTPAPERIPGFIARPGWAFDRSTAQYRPLPTPTRLPRPGPAIIRPCPKIPGQDSSVGYRDCDIEVVIGTVRDVDALEKHGPMVVLDVEQAFPADPGTAVVASLAIHGAPPWDGEPVAKGDRILVTLVREGGTDWACGRLRPCDGPPPSINWIGVEVFRPANWP